MVSHAYFISHDDLIAMTTNDVNKSDCDFIDNRDSTYNLI